MEGSCRRLERGELPEDFSPRRVLPADVPSYSQPSVAGYEGVGVANFRRIVTWLPFRKQAGVVSN